MKTFFSLLFLVPLVVFGQSAGFVIHGKVQGLADSATVKILKIDDNSELVSAPVRSNEFTLKGKLDEPGLYWLVMGSNQPIHIYVENTNIEVTGNPAQPKQVSITGSSSHNDFMEFQQIFNPLVGELNGTVALLNRTSAADPKFQPMMDRYDSITKAIQGQVDQYIAKKPASYVSVFVLWVTSQLYDDPVLLENRFLKLDAAIRQSQIGTSLQNFIEYNKVGAIGTQAIDFTQPDTDGKPVTLSSFRGKYVLVDFWASWCKPCREENPNVVASFNKFKNKNFTVLGVSLDRDDQKDKWLKAIQDDNLTWTHVSDLQFWNNEAAVAYHIQQIPFNILVDPKGKIIGKNLRGGDLDSKLCEVLGCN